MLVVVLSASATVPSDEERSARTNSRSSLGQSGDLFHAGHYLDSLRKSLLFFRAQVLVARLRALHQLLTIPRQYVELIACRMVPAALW